VRKGLVTFKIIDMKIFKIITSLTLAAVLLLNLSSCLVIHQKKDNGKHKGWFKSQHSPNHPAKANGKAQGHHKK
jgi:hypothetical protein